MAKAKRIPNAPGRGVWLAGWIFGGLGILAHFGYIAELYDYNFWLLLTGFGLLAMGTSFKDV